MDILYKGKLTFFTKAAMDLYCVCAWLFGEADPKKMKRRIKLGYEGFWQDHLSKYDALGAAHYFKIAETLAEGLDVKGKTILDVGCGTGIVSFLLLSRGASKVVCVDISQYMLNCAKEKADKLGYDKTRIDFCQADAEAMPFKNGQFDLVVSSMVLGLSCGQERMIEEMARVARPGGKVAFSTHGYKQYWEAIEVVAFIIFLRYGLVPYRPEYWSRTPKEARRLMLCSGLGDIEIRNNEWMEHFESGSEAFDFFAAVSSLWWYARFPSYKWGEYMEYDRQYFNQRKVKNITFDIVCAYGAKRA